MSLRDQNVQAKIVGPPPQKMTGALHEAVSGGQDEIDLSPGGIRSRPRKVRRQASPAQLSKKAWPDHVEGTFLHMFLQMFLQIFLQMSDPRSIWSSFETESVIKLASLLVVFVGCIG